MLQDRRSLGVETRQYRFTSYPDTFRGKDAVNWLIQNGALFLFSFFFLLVSHFAWLLLEGVASDEAEAVKAGQRLIEYNFI